VEGDIRDTQMLGRWREAKATLAVFAVGYPDADVGERAARLTAVMENVVVATEGAALSESRRNRQAERLLIWRVGERTRSAAWPNPGGCSRSRHPDPLPSTGG
jgi:hypothetical protein